MSMMRKFLPVLLCACFSTAALAQANQSDAELAAPAPQNRHQADERELQGSVPKPPPRPPERPESGAVNPSNGQYYPPAGNGDVINPSTGERYIGVPGGYVNPNTGELMPRIR